MVEGAGRIGFQCDGLLMIDANDIVMAARGVKGVVKDIRGGSDRIGVLGILTRETDGSVP